MHQLNEPSAAASLFAGWEETVIWSCLQGVMGAVYANAKETAAVAVLGDFAFFAGVPDASLTMLPGGLYPGRLFIARDNAWLSLLRRYLGDRAEEHDRYATCKAAEDLDRAALLSLARPPEGCTLVPIDAAIFDTLRQTTWGRDLIVNYADAAQYARLGLGFVLCRNGEIVAGASSYASYRGGIEIEVDTRPDCRRRGYATVCAAGLAGACLERGWYPSWDAHTPVSLHLAQKLGYRFHHAYPCLEITSVDR